MESIPRQSTRSTRSAPLTFVQQSHAVHMGSLFIKLEGKRKDYAQERFVILFASGTNRTSHYDILQASKGSSFVFTIKELPRSARKYWRILKPDEIQSSWNPNVWNVEREYASTESPPSPPDSPLWQLSQPVSLLKDDPLFAPLTVVAAKTVSFPKVAQEQMKWKDAFNDVFKNMNRVVFINQIVPNTVLNFSYILESQFQKPIADETMKLKDQGIRELMKGIWVCWESLTIDLKRQQTRTKSCKVYQDDIEACVLQESMRCLHVVHDSLMFFLHMIVSNISFYNRKPVCIKEVLDYLGFFSSTIVEIYRWLYGNVGRPEVAQSPITPEAAKAGFRSSFQFILERVKKSRNSSAHSIALSQKCSVAELLLALSMLSGISIMNPQSFNDISYNTTRWYG
jgi:hypothetical protein